MIIQPFCWICSTLKSMPAINEFKGNASGEKYQCILTDLKNKIVLDILPTRFRMIWIHISENMKMNNVGMYISLCLICGSRISEWRIFPVLCQNTEIMVWRHYQLFCFQLHQWLYRGLQQQSQSFKEKCLRSVFP